MNYFGRKFHNLYIHQIDVNTNFLYGELDEEI